MQDTIDAYKAGRLAEKDYLNKVTEIMESVLSRTGDKLPEILRDRDVAKAFYGVVNEVFARFGQPDDSLAALAAEAAVRIDDAVQGLLVVDWKTNRDVQNQMRNAIDDLLYALKAERGVSLTTDDMDTIVEKSLDIAKNRYAR